MSLVPYTPDLEAWKEHFKEGSDEKVQPLKSCKEIERPNGEVKVNVISPTAQTVKRAKALVKKKKTAF